MSIVIYYVTFLTTLGGVWPVKTVFKPARLLCEAGPCGLVSLVASPMLELDNQLH